MVWLHSRFLLPSADSSHFIKPRRGIFLLLFGVLAPTIRNSLLRALGSPEFRICPGISYAVFCLKKKRLPRVVICGHAAFSRSFPASSSQTMFLFISALASTGSHSI